MKAVIHVLSIEVTFLFYIMDVHLNSSHSRLRDGTSPSYVMNTENCGQVSGHQNNRVGPECESNLSINSDDLSNELKEKLRIACCGSGVGLINGCNKSLYDEVKGVDVTVNGLSNCHNLDLINSHVACSNRLFPQLQRQKEDESPQTTITESEVTVDAVTSVSDETTSHDRKYSADLSSISLSNNFGEDNITYVGYESEIQMPDIMRLIQKDLSEPYSIYTYRYFIHNWPKLCFLAHDNNECVGAIVCKLDLHKKHSRRGYIAMLAVDERYRKRKIGSNLVLKAIKAMVQDNADEVVLETEITNKPALRLYENLGFVRDKRLFRYYLNGVDALRLKLWLR